MHKIVIFYMRIWIGRIAIYPYNHIIFRGIFFFFCKQSAALIVNTYIRQTGISPTQKVKLTYIIMSKKSLFCKSILIYGLWTRVLHNLGLMYIAEVHTKMSENGIYSSYVRKNIKRSLSLSGTLSIFDRELARKVLIVYLIIIVIVFSTYPFWTVSTRDSSRLAKTCT